MKGYYREFQDGDDPTEAIYFTGPLVRIEVTKWRPWVGIKESQSECPFAEQRENELKADAAMKRFNPRPRVGRASEAFPAICVAWIVIMLCGCTIGRLDSDNLRIIPLSEVHRMDDHGWPLNVSQPKEQRLYHDQP